MSQSWLTRIGRANSEQSLCEIRDEAKAAGAWSRELSGACVERLDALRWPFGTDLELESRIRADERLKVLRETRKLASKMHKADSYNSAADVVHHLSKLVAEQRTVTGDQERVESEKWERTQRNRAVAAAKAEREAAEYRERNRRSLERYLKGLT